VVPWGGRQIFSVFTGISSETLEMRPALAFENNCVKLNTERPKLFIYFLLSSDRTQSTMKNKIQNKN